MPRFEADTLEEAIRKAVRGENYELKKGKPFGKPGGKYRGKPARSHLKQNNNLPMSQGFGRFRAGRRIPGTSREGFRSFEQAKTSVGRRFEELAKQYYPTQSAAFDRNQFADHNIIPELAARILARSGPSGSLLYSYPDFVAGTANPATGDGRVNLEASDLTVAVIHAHWLNTIPSPGERSNARRARRRRDTDVAAAEQIRERFGEDVRFFIYKWNGVWGEF